MGVFLVKRSFFCQFFSLNFSFLGVLFLFIFLKKLRYAKLDAAALERRVQGLASGGDA